MKRITPGLPNCWPHHKYIQTPNTIPCISSVNLTLSSLRNWYFQPGVAQGPCWEDVPLSLSRFCSEWSGEFSVLDWGETCSKARLGFRVMGTLFPEGQSLFLESAAAQICAAMEPRQAGRRPVPALPPTRFPTLELGTRRVLNMTSNYTAALVPDRLLKSSFLRSCQSAFCSTCIIGQPADRYSILEFYY